MRAMNWWAAIALSGGLAVGGCATTRELMRGDTQTIPLSVSSEIPSAQGTVSVTPEEGGNKKVEVTVEHLPAPARLPEGASSYVVWLKPSGADKPQNMGVLPVDKNLKGKLEFMTAFSDFEVFVTAEQRPDVPEPSQRELLEARVETQRTLR